MKKNPPENAIILSFDEKGKTPVKQYEGRKYTADKYFAPYKQKVKGIVDFFAVKNIHTGETFHYFYDWKNSFIVIDFFEKLLNKFSNKVLYII